jgi:hypothetical protein
MVVGGRGAGKYDAALHRLPVRRRHPFPMPPSPSALRVAIAGMLSLAVAMGIGRFAFTPLLPLMLAERLVDLPGASWLASTNYLGYLVGALACTVQPWIWRRARWLPPVHGASVVRFGLAATCLTTAGMALPAPSLWPALRFAAGVASALVFVFTSGWCLVQLARRDAAALGGVMYAGPGAGIVASGLAAGLMARFGQTAPAGWLGFGVLAAILSALVWQAFGDRAEPPAAGAPAAVANAPAAATAEPWLLALAYGLAGFGYIISATFLPVIARQAITGSAWLDMFWPVFGAGVVAGALLVTRVRGARDLRVLLAAGYAIQALGIAIGLWSPTVAGFACGSVLLGLPFTTITFFALQEARRLRPASAHSFIGLLTAMYGAGQIAGPLLAAAVLARSASPARGFDRSLEIAAAALVAGALLYLAIARAYPLRRRGAQM